MYYFRMDEMMRGQRGWRELSALGDKINKIGGMIEGLIWSPRGSYSNNGQDDWSFEEVFMQHKCINKLISPKQATISHHIPLSGTPLRFCWANMRMHSMCSANKK